MSKTHLWITGGGSGIGRSVARAAAAEGMLVTVSGRREDALEETSRDHASIFPAILDVTDAVGVDAVLDAIEMRHGPVDIAILNAARYQAMDAADFDSAGFRDHIETNVMGTVHCLAPLLARMRRRRKGRIVLIASVAGYRGLPKAAAYGPTKAALINLAESLRPGAAVDGVIIQVVNPGFVETPMTAGNQFPMPFLISPERAASHILAGLRRDVFEIAFPWPFVMLLKAARLLPYRLYFALTRRML
ncbi:SDR family NAD(P)-dependent oxidoreductase [Dongia sp.]|uniref:SDR family NAD(P)-dependent oxidoreductase n=1 Tax=Dongia sp. TaxID=1977262 RepID=UPI0035B17A3B